MMLILWGIIKTAFSVITSFVIKLIPYILKFWREILIGLVLILYFNEKSSHSATTQEYALFKQDIQLKSDAQALENSIKATQAAKEIQDAQFIHSKQLELLKDAYEKRNQVNVDTINNLRNRLRSELEAGGIRVPEIESYPDRPAQEWGIHYTNLARKYQTLIDACTLETADYNLLREWADASCAQIGCEP